MKYEMVFGDQSLFDGAPDDAEMAATVCQMPRWYTAVNGKVLFCDSKKESWKSADFNHPGSQLLAMRRIIEEPKRWTAEDRKAGRLPEVGAIVVSDGFNEKCEFLGVGMVNGFFVVRLPNGLISINSESSFSPIETPEEKAERLRSEWISKAYVDFHRLGCELEVLQKEQIKQIYDAMLSGELTMPNKDGE